MLLKNILLEDPILFILIVLVLVISIVLHELGHGYMALWNGDGTAKMYGRLTLNPIKHFDPYGFIMMLTIGFGYAKPVPVNPYNFRSYRKGSFLVAIAGVTVNFVLFLLFSLLTAIMIYVVCPSLSTGGYLVSFMEDVAYAFMFGSIINMNLALFNLLPLFPLDGFRIIESFTRETNPLRKFLREYGQAILICLFILSLVVDWGLLPDQFDILGTYLGFVGNNMFTLFMRLWGLIFA